MLRTSENAVHAKFREYLFHALECISLFIVLITRLSLIVTAKIILLGDVPMRTIPYPALMGGASI
jgi:hypothetical protein